MKWKLSLPKTPMLVYYYVKMTGLAPFTVVKDGFRPPTILGKLYSLVLVAIYSYIAAITANTQLKDVDAYTMSIFRWIGVIMQQLIGIPATFLTLVTFLLMDKKILYIMDKLRDIGIELKKLGIVEDQEKFFKNIFARIVMANAVIISIFVVLYYMEPNWPMIYSIKYAIDTWLYLNVILIFTEILYLIRQRFKLINEKLYAIFRPGGRSIQTGWPVGHRRTINNLQIFSVCRNCREENQLGIENLTDLQTIQKIEALHYQLCDLMYRTTDLFALIVVFKIVECCTMLITNSFWVYWISLNSDKIQSTVKFIKFTMGISCSLIRIAIASHQLFAIVYTSVKTCEEGNATKAVLFKVWYKFNLQDVQDELSMFSLQLMQKPVVVSVLGFFDLDYSQVYKIFCSFVAYLIILIQFDTSRTNTGT